MALRDEEIMTCPECGVEEQPLDHPGFGLDVKNITTEEDRWLGMRRYALRCQGCGFATSFVGKVREEDLS